MKSRKKTPKQIKSKAASAPMKKVVAAPQRKLAKQLPIPPLSPLRTQTRTAPNPPAKAASKPAAPVAAAPARPTAPPVTPSRAAKPVRARKAVALPPILLEGDVQPAPRISGPGERFALGPAEPPVASAPIQLPRELPEAYGTERLFLTARDPHWLYAAWDLTTAQRTSYNASSRDGHLIVRVYTNQVSGAPVIEAKVHPESKSWFIHAARGGTRYAAELGYFDRSNQWRSVAVSASTLTPPESVSQDTGVEFATIPPEVSLKKLFQVVQQAVSDHVPLGEAVKQLRAEGWTQLPEIVPASPPAWTPVQARALAKVVRVDDSRRVWMGSMEITELVRRHLQQEVSSLGVPPGPGPAPGARPPTPGEQVTSLVGAAGISSPSRPEVHVTKPGNFWLNVNAELVLYGATERDAAVSISGRKVQLRPDGTFSYRFALPDGQYALTLKAESADGSDQRTAKLEFERKTRYEGQVGAHPQDKWLNPPVPTHLA